MHTLCIDLETYSSVDITKSGLFKYVQSPDFQILLFAWSFDGGPVEVVDLTIIPTYLPTIVTQNLFNPGTIKKAYNAPFEWYCLSKYFGLFENSSYPPETWLREWRCTMLHGLYCGYPAGLDAVGRALELPQDKQKSSIGKALIRYFCIPCAPTKANGGRTRNLPHHDPEKWMLFMQYCGQDVVTEMAVADKLKNFPVPEFIQQQWITDQRINSRGVAMDIELIDKALWCADTVKQQLMTEAVKISGLDNPNSLQQLTKWLEEEMDEEITDLRKDTVKTLLGRDIDSDAARRMLEIRQLLGKTSTKKYNAMDAAICNDGRIRGLLMFYGAGRTGRWAGRIVQPQNLPRTHLEPLALARELVKGKQLDALKLVYGSIPDTLSQLIRTAFIAAPGHTFIDADFSAIEARVIAWLAGEEWVMEVFRTTGKIYEATAAQMFHVPFETISKGNPNYGLRQKGKVATLALGYQGGEEALKSMRKTYQIPETELPDAELPDIKNRWRRANPKIVQTWYDFQAAALGAVRNGRPMRTHGVDIARECDPANNLDFLTVRLPSGRKLYYTHPKVVTNRFGSDGIGYYGLNQTTKKWEQQETYGGKLVENAVQAIARDCLAVAIERLEASGYHVGFHVHDEVVIETPCGVGNLDAVCKIISDPMPWAPDLLLNADGWVGDFYRKD
jgi:DNA polymerase bacteriophage-type